MGTSCVPRPLMMIVFTAIDALLADKSVKADVAFLGGGCGAWCTSGCEGVCVPPSMPVKRV